MSGDGGEKLICGDGGEGRDGEEPQLICSEELNTAVVIYYKLLSSLHLVSILTRPTNTHFLQSFRPQEEWIQSFPWAPSPRQYIQIYFLTEKVL